jgi:hypothetical protein
MPIEHRHRLPHRRTFLAAAFAPGAWRRRRFHAARRQQTSAELPPLALHAMFVAEMP